MEEFIEANGDLPVWCHSKSKAQLRAYLERKPKKPFTYRRKKKAVVKKHGRS